MCFCVFFFFKQKTAYDMRISDWSSYVCSSDLITDQSFGGCHSKEWARCDLALPAGELRAIAGVLDTLPWIEQAAEDGGALYIRLSYDKAWLLQERAFHAALTIVRRLVAASLERLRHDDIPATPKPLHVQDREIGRAHV